MGGDLDEEMAEGEIVAGEAALFRAENDRDAVGALTFLDEIREKGELDDGLVRLAVGDGRGSDNESAVGDRLLEGVDAAGVLEQSFRANGRFGLAPVWLIRGDDGEAGEAEVGEGAGGCSYIEGIARRDEDDVEVLALGWGEQELMAG
jgi:hypothetical protein